MGELLQRFPQVFAKFLVAFRAAGEPDDGEVIGQEFVFGQMIKGGNDFAMGEIARGPEDDRRRGRHLRGCAGNHWRTGGVENGDEGHNEFLAGLGRSGVVGCGSSSAALSGPVGVEEFLPRLVDTLVGVGAKIVALGLKQIGGEPGGTIGIVKGQRIGEGRSGDAQRGAEGDGAPPAALRLLERVGEEGIEDEVGQVGICLLYTSRCV